MQKVTINVVAKHVGVSKKTISRVINNEPSVSDKTKEKVLAAFSELGYRPNQQARGLATNQSFLLGLIYDNPNKAYVSDIQEGALKVCQQNGYHLLIHPVKFKAEDLLGQLSYFIEQSRVDGLVLTPPFSDMQPLLEMLDNKNVTYVRIAPTLQHSSSPYVISNDNEAAYEMTKYLLSLQHNKIAFIKGHPDHKVSEQRLAGYKRALKEASVEINPEYIEQGFFTFDSGEECATRLLAQKNRPTAIFASNDYMAAGVIKVANKLQLKVPKDLSVVGFDNAPITGYLWPSITTVQQPVQLMAEQALNLLLSAIKGFDLSEIPYQFSDQLILRESSDIPPD